MEPIAALNSLLKGTGLRVAAQNSRTIIVAEAEPAPAKVQLIRLAQQDVPDAAPREPAPPPPAPDDSGTNMQDIVVTATRQSDTVSRVPLSITALTQKALEAQNIRDVQELSRTVPAVTFRRSGADNNPNISIRGITSTLGASTTGVYLDDTALQKRGTIGFVTGNGSPFPILFDLDRVEVLKGPQGTLFGASSEGGTVRFITPVPSLTKYSGNFRVGANATEHGGFGYEFGAAVGGPDRPGFAGLPPERL